MDIIEANPVAGQELDCGRIVHQRVVRSSNKTVKYNRVAAPLPADRLRHIRRHSRLLSGGGEAHRYSLTIVLLCL